jgi:hypothetical protein
MVKGGGLGTSVWARPWVLGCRVWVWVWMRGSSSTCQSEGVSVCLAEGAQLSRPILEIGFIPSHAIKILQARAPAADNTMAPTTTCDAASGPCPYHGSPWATHDDNKRLGRRGSLSRRTRLPAAQFPIPPSHRRHREYSFHPRLSPLKIRTGGISMGAHRTDQRERESVCVRTGQRDAWVDQRWLRNKSRRPSSGLTHAWLDRVPANFPRHASSSSYVHTRTPSSLPLPLLRPLEAT